MRVDFDHLIEFSKTLIIRANDLVFCGVNIRKSREILAVLLRIFYLAVNSLPHEKVIWE